MRHIISGYSWCMFLPEYQEPYCLAGSITFYSFAAYIINQLKRQDMKKTWGWIILAVIAFSAVCWDLATSDQYASVYRYL